VVTRPPSAKGSLNRDASSSNIDARLVENQRESARAARWGSPAAHIDDKALLPAFFNRANRSMMRFIRCQIDKKAPQAQGRDCGEHSPVVIAAARENPLFAVAAAGYDVVMLCRLIIHAYPALPSCGGERRVCGARGWRWVLTEIGFADHSPMRKDNFDEGRMNSDKLSEYVEKCRKARRDFPQLTIQVALEWISPRPEEWIVAAARHTWIFHRLGALRFGIMGQSTARNQLAEWRKHDAYESGPLFDWLTRAADSGLFEIIGHAICRRSLHLP